MIIVTKLFDSYRQSDFWYDTSQKIGHPKWFLKKIKSFTLKIEGVVWKLKKICHRSSWNHFMLSNYHTTVKKSTAFDTEISTEIPIALKPPSHRVWTINFRIVCRRILGYELFQCSHVFRQGISSEFSRKRKFFFPFTTPVGLVASPREKRATMAHAMQAYLVSLGTCWWNDHYCFN